MKLPPAEEELEQLRARLAEVQRAQSTSTLAAGLVHDLNNAMSAIAGLAELAAESIGDHPGRKDLVTIAREAMRAGELTHSLLAYARRSSPRREIVHVDDLLDDVEPLITRLVANRIVVERRGSGCLAIEADVSELRRAIVNLCVNGAAAIDGRGRLTLSAGKRHLDAVVGQRLGVPAGTYATIAVHDTGIGMDEEVRAQIFEPYFTTKSDGTGLGLAMVLDTVRAHAGAIDVDTAPGCGSTFTLYLPISNELRPPRAVRGTGSMVRMVKLAVVIDDQPRTREVAARILRGMGLAVIEASDGDEALQVIAARREDVRLVLVDPALPGIDPPVWLADLRARTRAPIVLMPVAETAETDALLATPNTSRMPKPYRIDDLRIHVEQLLEL